MGWAACLGESMLQLPKVGWRLLACENGASPGLYCCCCYCCCCFGEALTHVFVHTRKIRKRARLATNSCTTGGLTPGSSTPGVSATPEPSMTKNSSSSRAPQLRLALNLRDNRRSAKNGAKCAENPFTAAITSTAQSQNPTSLHDHRDDPQP